MRISQVDAFASKPFSGNPAAVCVLPEPRPDGWMQDLARQMNLSETAFLRARPADGFDRRWFTPEHRLWAWTKILLQGLLIVALGRTGRSST